MYAKLALSLRDEAFECVKEFLYLIKEIGLAHIGYREFYKNGTSKAFCSNMNWYGINIELDMRLHYLKELMFIIKNNFDYIIRTENNIYNNFLKALNSYGMCNSIVLYKTDLDIIRQFSFIAKNRDKNSVNIFVNHLKSFSKLSDLLTPKLSRIFQDGKYAELNKPLISENVIQNTIFYGKKSRYEDTQSLLTSRERECFDYFLMGISTKKVASNLYISTKTVEYHFQNIKRKLKINSKSQAIEMYSHR